MPGHNQHCDDCVKKLGKPFSEVHDWLDALYDGEDPIGHRDARHHMGGVEEVRKLWGDDAARGAILHIMLDWELTDEGQIPRDQKEAETFRAKWFANLPRLDEPTDTNG
ncbi:MAG: hypothetical protein HY360_26240 [Verrucomicrobia bacterium]|nr:hypothetical protein [Verrucomicrobiota bacterium]